MKIMLLGMAIILFGIAWLVMFQNDARNDIGFNIAIVGLIVAVIGLFLDRVHFTSDSKNSSNENTISKVICPNCNKEHDIDYPKCPYCKHQY